MVERDAATRFGEVDDWYIATWDESDPGARRRAVAGLWTEDGTYTDPLAAVEGHDAIEAEIADARERIPGHVFELLGNVDAYHNLPRFRWELVPESGGEPVMIGFDVAVVTDERRLSNVYRFLDEIPAS